MALSAGQFVARNADNTEKNPQPGDVEVTDAFDNIFDNFNQYGTGDREVRFYDENNVLLDPQPAYQNGNYVQRDVDNQPVTPAFEPDAAQWVARGVDNQVRTPQAYVRSPLYPTGAPTAYSVDTFFAVLEVEQGLAYLVEEDDVHTLTLEGVDDHAEVARYI